MNALDLALRRTLTLLQENRASHARRRLLALAVALAVFGLCAPAATASECGNIAAGFCGNLAGVGVQVWWSDIEGPSIPGVADLCGYFCDKPLAGAPFYRLADPNCNPQNPQTTCQIHVVVPLTFPGFQSSNCFSHPLIDWYAAPSPPAGSGTTCGTAGQGRVDTDRVETFIVVSGINCLNLDPQLAPVSLRARTCPTTCTAAAEVAEITIDPIALGEAIGCFAPPPPPQGPCGCECKPGGASPGGDGGSAGGGSGDGPPGDGWGTGAHLRYRAGGGGHPGYPGSAEWQERLGLYWSHDYAIRIVPDPDETNVWLITEGAIFRNFSSPDGGGVYQSVSTTAEKRTLTWLNPGWNLRELDGTVHAFDASGRWISTIDRNGNAKTGCYDSEPACDGPGPLIAVDKPDGRREEFVYNASGKLASITEVGVGAAASRIWSLTWSWNGDRDELVRLGRPDDTALRFFYEVSGRPGYLSRIELVAAPGSPALSNRILRAWEYDGFGNVVRTWKGALAFDDLEAVEKWEFSFDDPAQPAITTVTDPLSEIETYTIGREAGSNVARVEGLSTSCPVCSLSGSVALDYADSANALLPTLLTDGEGITTALAHDAFGQLVSRIEVANDPNSHPDLPRETTWEYHPTFPAFPTVIEGPVTMGQAASRRVDLVYDGTNGDLLSRTESGNEATYPTGSFSLVTSYPDYNAAGQVETIDPPGYGTIDQTTFTYDPTRGNLLPLTRQDPLLSQPTQFGYDPFNRRMRVTDPNGVHTETEYDSMGRVTRTIQRSDNTTLPNPPVAADLVTIYEYDRYGDLFRVTLPQGNVIEYGYDHAGRLVSIERKANASTAGERTFFSLDGAANRTREELQRWTGSAWDPVVEKEFVYTSRCRLEKVIEAPGTPEESLTDYAYDCNGNLVDVWDGNHDRATDPASSHYEYDELSRLAEVHQPWEPGGEAVTTYGYDVQDHLTSVLDAEGNLTTYEHSDRDLLTEEDSLVSGTTTHTYNDHGELETSEDAREVTTIRTVDALDRVLDITYDPGALEEPPFPGPVASPRGLRLLGSPAITFSYDTAPASCGAQEDFPIGRLASITRDGETIEYCYDRYGRVTRDGDLTYGYDENGNRTTIGYPGGVTASYAYDRADRPLSLTVDDPVNPPQTVASAATYAPFGPLTGLTLGNGVVETRGFDGQYQPTAITAGSLLDWSYETDGVGNVLSITDELPGGDPVRSFAYQGPQYFLTGGTGPWGALAWTYDRIGNRITEDRDGTVDVYDYLENSCTPPGPPGRPCPGNTAILETVTLGGAGGSRAYTFGPAGHLEQVAAGANEVMFNVGADGRLLGVVRPAAEESAEFTYDGRSFLSRARDFEVTAVVFADGLETGDTGCWSDIVGGAFASGAAECFSNEARRTRPLYDSHGLVHAVRRRANQSLQEDGLLVFYFAGRPVAQLELQAAGGATHSYLTSDHLGTPVLATDSAGALVWRGGFEPFGTDWQAGGAGGATENGVLLRLPGQWEDVLWQDASLGASIYYNLHRWYERGTGRYTRKDPVGDVESREDLPWYPRFETERFSFYSYVDGNPLVFVDPLGLLKFKGCTPDEQTQITEAFKEYCAKIEAPQFKGCMCENPGIPAGLKNKCDKDNRTVRCRDDRTGLCSDDPGTYECGWSIPFGRKIRLCPDAWIPGACGPLGCTLMHEMTHQLGHAGESKDMAQNNWPILLVVCWARSCSSNHRGRRGVGG